MHDFGYDMKPMDPIAEATWTASEPDHPDPDAGAGTEGVVWELQEKFPYGWTAMQATPLQLHCNVTVNPNPNTAG